MRESIIDLRNQVYSMIDVRKQGMQLATDVKKELSFCETDSMVRSLKWLLDSSQQPDIPFNFA